MASDHQVQAQVAQALAAAKQAQDRLATIERNLQQEKALAAKLAQAEKKQKELLAQTQEAAAKAATQAAAKKEEKGPARIPGTAKEGLPPSKSLGQNPGLNVAEITRRTFRGLPRMT